MPRYNDHTSKTRGTRKSAFDDSGDIAHRKAQREAETVSTPHNPAARAKRAGTVKKNSGSVKSESARSKPVPPSSCVQDEAEQFAVGVRLASHGRGHTLTPLAIYAFNSDPSVEGLDFDVSILHRAANRLTITVSTDDGTIIYQSENALGCLDAGTYRWTWNGYSNRGILDTRVLKSKIIVDVEGCCQSTVAADRLKISGRAAHVDWVDVSVNRATSSIDVYLRPNFTDGGVRDLPKGEIPLFSHEELVKLAERGIELYWSRNVCTMAGAYKLIMHCKSSSAKCMDDVSIIYNAGEWLRSSNPGTMTGNPITWIAQFAYERIVYNHSSARPKTHFMITSAHEIGHEILKSYGGTAYSYEHKGTSTLFQSTKAVDKGGENEPTQPDEVDLMKYYNKIDWATNVPRIKASEADALSLLWLAAVCFK